MQREHLKETKNYSEVCLKVPPGKYKENPNYREDPDDNLDYWSEYLYAGPQQVLDICKYNPLYLVVEPQKFVINPEKGNKFSIKSLSKNPQDVIVTCHSFMFEIKDARRKLGITSQWFHVIRKDETKTFRIVMKDAKDESFVNFINSPFNWACGVFEITHYKSRISGSYTKPKVTDSDKEWGIEGSNLLIRTTCNGDHYQGYWFDKLDLKSENEESKKRKYRFMELLHASIQAQEIDGMNQDKSHQEMFTDKDLGYVDHDGLGLIHDHVPDDQQASVRSVFGTPVRTAVGTAVEEQGQKSVVEKKKKKWSLMNFLKKKPK